MLNGTSTMEEMSTPQAKESDYFRIIRLRPVVLWPLLRARPVQLRPTAGVQAAARSRTIYCGQPECHICKNW